MQARYDAIVIGTGFGGAVSACRLSQAGLKVGVLERGRRYPLGGFPRNWNDPLDGWLWSTKQGLFDVRPFEQMMVVQSAGYGGGSLIYANVHLRVTPSVFASGWPANYSREVLDPYYDLVAYMLDIVPITTSPLGVPPKATLMQQAATALGRADQFCFPNIAVDLGAAEAVHANKFGVTQSGCRYCGECVIGCNFHSKNTLDLNYLALAQTCGADVTVQCEVTRIEAAAGGNGYIVSFVNHAAGGAVGQTAAARVFLCAGAVNSTELLLKCRDEYQTLPNLSNQLGLRYSGNGDFLAFAFDTSTPAKPSDGPTITAGIVYDRPENGSPVWFILEEGGYPKEIGGLLQAINPKGGFLKGEAAITAFALRDQLLGAARAKAATMAASDNTQVFLAMGRDTASGRIGLSPVAHDLQIKWDTVANLPLYDAEARLVADFAGAMGGRPVDNPFWHVLHQPVSVHNLGGCVMGDSRASGVTDPNGEVYGYPGLYVMDGAILPVATGVNPSHTIAAVAERNVEAAIRNLKQDPNWTAPERAEAKPVVDPTSKITVPAGGTAPPKTQAIGLGFTETMKGYGVKGFQPTDDYAGGEHAGKRVGTIIDFTLTITTPDLDAFLADPNATAIANGVVQVDGFTGPGGAPVANGVFNLFVPTGQADQRKMLYALPFTGMDGNPYLLDGFKDVKDNGRFDVWGATSTLYTVIRSGHDRSGAIVETGILHILMQDFMHQLTTFEVTGTTNPAQKADALARFGKRFFGTLWGVFVLPHFERSRT